jgi:hypothetical protein
MMWVVRMLYESTVATMYFLEVFGEYVGKTEAYIVIKDGGIGLTAPRRYTMQSNDTRLRGKQTFRQALGTEINIS